MKRFYEDVRAVAVDGNWSIALDNRSLKTPDKNDLILPTRALAAAIAGEWRGQGDDVDLSSMPLSGFANAALDRVVPNRKMFVDQLARYAQSDLLCYRAVDPEDLRERQAAIWQPVLDWAADAVGHPFSVSAGIIHVDQPRACIDGIRALARALADFELTALCHLAGSLGSVVLAFAVSEGHLNADEAFQASILDELYQEEKWGTDRDALNRRSGLESEVRDAARFLALVRT